MTRETLFRIGWRYLFRHPWQSALMILGITLGVAVVVAIDIANASASRAFELSTEAVTGRATHQITGGPTGLDETLYARLRLDGMLQAAAPVVIDYVSSSQLGNLPLQLLGVDPFAEAPFRDYLDGSGPGAIRPGSADLTTFLTQPGATLISGSLADRYGVVLGDHLTLEIGGQERQAFIAGLLEQAGGESATTRLGQRALDGILLTDIATAQELTGRLGFLDRIELILPPACDGLPAATSTASAPACPQLEHIRAWLPAQATLLPVEARTGTVQEMTSAFRLNLTALSLLALVVGLFLIYNTITFSVVQRRPFFGTLRCLGVTRGEIFSLVASEALLAGAIGAGLGILLGVVMGQGAVRMVTQTINDLYFVVTVRGIQIPPASLVKGALLGVAATVLAAAPPAWEAASVPPRAALSRSVLEGVARRAASWAALGGLLLLSSGALLLLLPTRNLAISFSGTFAILVGSAMLVPALTKVLMQAAIPLFGRAWGALGRMAPRDVINSLSRTSIAISALMVAVSVTIGVSLMVNSFRQTVITWLDQTLQGDVYLSAPGLIATRSSAELDPQVIRTVKAWPGVARVDLLRSAVVDSPQGPVHVAATDNPTIADERIFLAALGPAAEVEAAMQRGAVLVSEPFANRTGLPRRNGRLELHTSQGLREFPVAGIYYDYASTEGTVLMALETYRNLWEDDALTAMALRLSPGTDADALARDLTGALAPIQRLNVRPNQALRSEVLEVFDRTFAITGALQLLATVVAFIGVLSAMLSLQLERRRELGILRAVGLTARQLWTLVMVETGLMGAVAGLLAMPVGYILALILVYIINRRSFGWTLQLQIDAAPFFLALGVAVLAALLAGVYPAKKMGRLVVAAALRSE